MTPARPGFGDHLGSVSLAFGLAGALYRRSATGVPSVVETSLLATAAWALSGDITFAQHEGYQAHNDYQGRFPLMSPYATKDDMYIQLMFLDPEPYWPDLCKILGCEEFVKNPRFIDNSTRTKNAKELVPLLAERFKKRTWAEWRPMFEAFDAPWELVRNVYDVRDDAQMVANEMIFDVKTAKGQDLLLVAGPMSVDGRPFHGEMRRAPEFGQHTDEILREIGLTDQEITGLKEKRVVR